MYLRWILQGLLLSLFCTHCCLSWHHIYRQGTDFWLTHNSKIVQWSSKSLTCQESPTPTCHGRVLGERPCDPTSPVSKNRTNNSNQTLALRFPTKMLLLAWDSTTTFIRAETAFLLLVRVVVLVEHGLGSPVSKNKDNHHLNISDIKNNTTTEQSHQHYSHVLHAPFGPSHPGHVKIVSTGSTQFKNLRAWGCSDPSIARALPKGPKVSKECRSCWMKCLTLLEYSHWQRQLELVYWYLLLILLPAKVLWICKTRHCKWQTTACLLLWQLECSQLTLLSELANLRPHSTLLRHQGLSNEASSHWLHNRKSGISTSIFIDYCCYTCIVTVYS